jgi:hypothetical protein
LRERSFLASLTQNRGLSPVFIAGFYRQFFLDHLAAVAAEESVAVHAYVLMTGLVHKLGQDLGLTSNATVF